MLTGPPEQRGVRDRREARKSDLIAVDGTQGDTLIRTPLPRPRNGAALARWDNEGGASESPPHDAPAQPYTKTRRAE